MRKCLENENEHFLMHLQGNDTTSRLKSDSAWLPITGTYLLSDRAIRLNQSYAVTVSPRQWALC